MAEPTEIDDSRDAPSTFPIVGVGASAGGLAPTVELLRALSPEPGVAIVIVHHLDPTHASGLVEIVARATSMPVAAATDGALVERNHVYVIPPNAGLLIREGFLKVVPRIDEGGFHLPIDRFFESLAGDRVGDSVGIVLSGGGFDGTEGIHAIKREGGITLAQDATAECASMPDSAIATGCVDFVLPPSGLAREVERIGAHASALGADPHPLDSPAYARIVAAMRHASGVDFASYKPTTIRRRIHRRVLLRGLADATAYVELLMRDAAEVEALCEEVLIHVTSFFREPAAFEALGALVLARLCEGRSRDTPIRVWVPGCSTGEEVYSIAICLLELFGESYRDLRIQIFGTDLSMASVASARAGTYASSIERDVPPPRLQRFFRKMDGGYQIRREVRDICVFAKHDVTCDPPFSGMDLISCRNLMIYLGAELQERVLGLFHYALKEPGILALGSSETVGTFAGFTVVDGKNKIYARTSSVPRTAVDFTTLRRPFDFSSQENASSTSIHLSASTRTSMPSAVHREADRLVLAEFAPAGVVVTDDLAIVQFRGQTGQFLEPTPGTASLDLMRLAREELRIPLRRAIDRARTTRSGTKEPGLTLLGDTPRAVTLEIIPFSVASMHQRFFLVLFEDVAPNDVAPESLAAPTHVAEPTPDKSLRNELAATRQYLESVIEQLEAANDELKVANEEVVSSNEELRSTNEELQLAKEEQQATNEELHTVNDELIERNVEATRLSDDLTNVLASVDIPIVFVGRDACVRRFTLAAGRLFGLVDADVGRSFGRLARVDAIAPALAILMSEVLEHLRPAECTIQDAAGRWFQLTVRPYVTLDGRIDGTVVSARDVDAEKKAAGEMAAARTYAQGIVENLRDGLLVLDRELRVTSANKAFLAMFGVPASDVAGRKLDAIGGELASPQVTNVLRELGRQDMITGIRFDVGIASDHRVVMMNARRIQGTELLLVAFEDITNAERAQLAAKRAELGDILTAAAQGVLMVDVHGKIAFANHAATLLFGYSADDLLGLPVDRIVPEGAREIDAGQRGHDTEPTSRPSSRELDLIGRRKDGTEFPMRIATSTVARDDVPIAVAFLTDMTKQHEADAKIHEYQGWLQRMAFDATLTEERERRRIAIALHDGIGQSLALAQIKLSAVRADVAGAPRAAVDQAVALLEKAIADQHTLIFDLSPPILYDLGLEEAVAWLAEDIESRHGLKIEVVDDGSEKPLENEARALVFRAVRELLMNVLKHAKTSSAKVSLRSSEGCVDIDIEDGGVGFDSGAVDHRRDGTGFGLLSVREQIMQLGGTLQIDSTPDRGTHVRVRVPLRAIEGSAP